MKQETLPKILLISDKLEIDLTTTVVSKLAQDYFQRIRVVFLLKK